MDLKKGSRIAVIGGVWATAYPEIHLLNFQQIRSIGL
jgi:hypothetical protein